MLIHVIARGRAGRSLEAELVARYRKRMRWPLKLTELPEHGGRIPPRDTPGATIVLDERGEMFSSETFAQTLGAWRDDGYREARILIGAADGHEEQARREADLVLAFGAATWPHLLVRAMLMEQLYRAETIISGHPYHRSG